MKKSRSLLSLIIAVPIVAGISSLYRPYIDVRFGAALDLLFVILLFFAIRAAFSKFES